MRCVAAAVVLAAIAELRGAWSRPTRAHVPEAIANFEAVLAGETGARSHQMAVPSSPVSSCG